MSISRQNLSIVIVTLKSEKVIQDCIKSINLDIPIIVVENSNNKKFKNQLEAQFKNLRCILANKNIGMGAGNNIGIKEASTEYVLILNPDVILQENTLINIFATSKDISNFSILSPISSDRKFPNYKMNDNQKINNEKSYFEVDHVDGFAMLLNKKKFLNNIYFDENFFLYLENNDLCLQVKKNGGKIFVIPSSIVNHKGSSAVDPKFKTEVELSRNWHWIWSKFYFNKKHYSFIRALLVCFPTYCSSILKFLLYMILGNHFKRKIYFNRASGFLNAVIGKSSWYRPKINDD